MISLISTRGSLLCRLLGPITNTPQLFSRSSCNRLSLVPAAKSFSTDPPKAPATGYIRFLLQQQTVLLKQFPDIKYVDITRKAAQQWNALTPQQKAPFLQAAKEARETYKEQLKRFQAQLTPEQAEALRDLRKQKMARRKTIRAKREQTSLGKPKRPRTAFNIFMSENFSEGRGTTMQAKMKSLIDDWARLGDSLKKTYKQLAEDDRVRYAHEMESWEKYMAEIGRDDLIRRKVRSKKTAGATKDEAKKTDKMGLNVIKPTRLKRPEE